MVTGFIKTFRFVFLLIFLALPAGAAEPVTVLAFGDSLTAGYGLDPGEALPDQLEEALGAAGIAANVVNAGVSGDTTAGGLARLDWMLAGLPNGLPDLVIVALGANDALRGIAPELTRANLAAMIEMLQARDVPVMLAGMVAPPNMGPDYATLFNPIYGDLAQKYDVPLYPFLLEGVAAEPSLNQADGMHPTANGVRVIVDRLTPAVMDALAGAGK